MDEKKRYKLFKLFLIFTILNLFGIFLYENIEKNPLFKKKPEFYVESIKQKNDNTDDESDKKEKSVVREGLRNLSGGKLLESRMAKVLVLGDSNAYLMGQNLEEYEKVYGKSIYWIAESGAGIDFIGDDLKIKLGKIQGKYIKNTLTATMEADLVREIDERGITDVAVILGVNSPEENSAEKLSGNLIKLSKKSKAKIFYVSILPYVDKSRYSLNNKDILKFNETMKKNLAVSGVKYLDSYGKVRSYKGYEKETTDGIHYSKVIYDKVFEGIMENIIQNNQK